MTVKIKIPWRFWRRAGQVVFFGLFLYLLRRTEYAGLDPVPGAVNILFRLDPLVAAAAMLSGKVLIAAFIPAAALLILTALFGRFFCGWICPMGTLIDAAGHAIPRAAGRPPRSWRKVKYFLLGTTLAAAVAGLPLSGYFDPFPILVRGFAFSLDPALSYLVRTPFDWIYKNCAEGVSNLTEPVYGVLKDHLLAARPAAFSLAGLSLGILAAILVLERFERRFWCRNLCPAGALFALAARFPLLKRMPPQSCKSCGECGDVCRMGAFDAAGLRSPEACSLCLDCLDRCPKEIATFSFRRTKAVPAPFEPSRRLFLGAAGAGLALALTSRIEGRERGRPGVIRPPGAPAEEAFIDLCIRCGECLKVCPTNVLQPTWLESGWEGIFSPRLDTRTSYCEFNCTLCGEVCPTGAIRRLTEDEKHRTIIGKAEFDRNRCLPFARGEPCIVCEEHCPTPEKAILFTEVEVTNPRGEKVKVKQPFVKLDLCVGCGICENKCPILGTAGVRVLPLGDLALTREMIPPPP